MSAEHALDLTRESLELCLVLAGPLLAALLAAGVVFGILQTAFQVHEHALSFVPKLVAVAIVLMITMPWFFTRLVEFAHHLISNIPQRL